MSYPSSTTMFSNLKLQFFQFLWVSVKKTHRVRRIAINYIFKICFKRLWLDHYGSVWIQNMDFSFQSLIVIPCDVILNEYFWKLPWEKNNTCFYIAIENIILLYCYNCARKKNLNGHGSFEIWFTASFQIFLIYRHIFSSYT